MVKLKDRKSRTLEASEYRQVANLHIAALKDGFLRDLGEDFLTVMYECISECPTAFLQIEKKEGVVIGFITGTASMYQVYRLMLKKRSRFWLAIFPSLISFRRLKGIAEIFLYSLKRESKTDLPLFELLSLAVSENERGAGISDRLYSGLTEFCRDRGIDSFKIVVGEELVSAHRFYLRMGAKPVSKVEIHGNVGSTVYVYKIS